MCVRTLIQIWRNLTYSMQIKTFEYQMVHCHYPAKKYTTTINIILCIWKFMQICCSLNYLIHLDPTSKHHHELYFPYLPKILNLWSCSFWINLPIYKPAGSRFLIWSTFSGYDLPRHSGTCYSYKVVLWKEADFWTLTWWLNRSNKSK